MGVPRYIEEKMHKAAFKFAEANTLLREVEDYFEKRGITNETLQSGGYDGFSDLATYDVTSDLVKRLDKMLDDEREPERA